MTVPDRSRAAACDSKAARFDFSPAWRAPNKSITDKIRQQLQVLRDLGLLEFLGSVSYRLHCDSKCLICAINSSKKRGSQLRPLLLTEPPQSAIYGRSA